MTGYEKSLGESAGPGRGRSLVLTAIVVAVGGSLCLASSPAKSDEQLCPKYGECVPASAFECSDVTRSSLVTRVCYSAPKEYMVVRLKTTDYHYCAIPPDVVTAFIAAESMGRFYNQNIKSDSNDGLYDCRSHPVPTF